MGASAALDRPAADVAKQPMAQFVADRSAATKAYGVISVPRSSDDIEAQYAPAARKMTEEARAAVRRLSDYSLFDDFRTIRCSTTFGLFKGEVLAASPAPREFVYGPEKVAILRFIHGAQDRPRAQRRFRTRASKAWCR